MSQPSTSSRFFVALAGSLIVVGATWMVRHPSDATMSAGRGPASATKSALRTDAAKKARLEEHQALPAAGKATGNFSIVITTPDISAPSTRVHLVAAITAERPMASHEFSWILPNGYEVIEGSKTGKIPDLQMGQIHKLEVTIERGEQPVQPIVLHVFELVRGEPHGQVAQFDVSSGVTTDKSSSVGGVRKSEVLYPDQNYVQ